MPKRCVSKKVRFCDLCVCLIVCSSFSLIHTHGLRTNEAAWILCREDPPLISEFLMYEERYGKNIYHIEIKTQ